MGIMEEFHYYLEKSLKHLSSTLAQTENDSICTTTVIDFTA
jgi:hypothetical protein